MAGKVAVEAAFIFIFFIAAWKKATIELFSFVCIIRIVERMSFVCLVMTYVSPHFYRLCGIKRTPFTGVRTVVKIFSVVWSCLSFGIFLHGMAGVPVMVCKVLAEAALVPIFTMALFASEVAIFKI